MTIIETMARAMNPPQTIGLAGGARSRELTFDDLDESARKESRDQARAALRAIKPEDVSDDMVEAFFNDITRPEAADAVHYVGKRLPYEQLKQNSGGFFHAQFRRAIAAAIAAGAEQ